MEYAISSKNIPMGIFQKLPPVTAGNLPVETSPETMVRNWKRFIDHLIGTIVLFTANKISDFHQASSLVEIISVN